MTKPKSRKAKGRKLQQWVRDLILDLWEEELEEDDVRSTSMGVSGEDVQFSPKARSLLELSIECKARNNITVFRWYEQAKANAPEGTTPVLVVKEDRKKPLVILDAEEFFRRMRECSL